MAKAFIDAGELGWTLYLSAHIRWLNDPDTLVFTNRQALFRECKTVKPPSLFIDKYKDNPQGCMGRWGVSAAEIVNFFKPYLPKGYKIHFQDTSNYREIFKGQMTFKPYEPRVKMYTNTVVVFPRYRSKGHFKERNLPKAFYENLVEELLKTNYLVLSVGSREGAYNLSIKHNRFVDLVGHTDIQDLIDICTNARATIGGTSAPPKLALLQGTPSYIIGHEEERFVKEENWANTKVKFWRIRSDRYNDFSDKNCIRDIVEWVK